MRDEKDPGTLEMALPRKRGRPAKGDVAMSGAERARLYRSRRKVASKYVWADTIQMHGIGGDQVSDAVVIDGIRDAIRIGDRVAVLDLANELIRRYS